LTNPNPDGLLGCDPYVTNADCGPGGLDLCDYNTFADGVLSAVSHEHNESITDPEPNNAWTDWETNPPYQGGTEIGDLCNDDAGSDGDNTQYVEQANFHFIPHNMTIGAHTYWIQGEYSDQGTPGHRCQFAGSTYSTPPPASFQAVHQSGTTMTFSATSSSSTTEYTWQFNDDVHPGDTPQLFTVSCPALGGGPSGCNGSTVSHTFPRGGNFTVALTTFLTNGRAHGGALGVHVVQPPIVHIAAHGTPLAGATISFSSAGTSHDPTTSIAHYLWHFGDGGTSGAANPTHRYSRGGTYNVSLAVTDSKGLSGSSGGHLTIIASCRVPNVKGKTLSGARTALTAAHCVLGQVTRPHKVRKHKRLVVKSQSPSPGNLVRAGTAVKVTLVYT
jgi:PKD repeat protein